MKLIIEKSKVSLQPKWHHIALRFDWKYNNGHGNFAVFPTYLSVNWNNIESFFKHYAAMGHVLK